MAIEAPEILVERSVRQSGEAGQDISQFFESTRQAASVVSGIFTSGSRADRIAAVGEADGDRWKETDTGWLYYYDSGWHYESGLYSATDAQRAALTLSTDDNGAWLLTTDTDLFWQVVSGAWVQRGVTGAGAGDVTGPASSVDDRIATFDGTTGKVIQDSGKALPAGDVVGTTDSQALTSKTLQTTGAGLDIKLGGTTSSFPAIKRNTTIIQFRLADDSAFCVADGTFRGFYNATFTFSFGALNTAGTAYRVIINKSDAAHIQTHSTGQYSWGSTTGTQNSESPDTGLARASAATVKPTNGSSGYGKFEMASGVTWQSGSGSPEGVVTASVGSLYTRTDGGAGTTLYIKESGSGNTGWIPK